MTIRLPFIALLLLAAREPARSQELRGKVIDSASQRPIGGAVVVALDSAGATVARTITNEHGLYRLSVAGGVRQLRTLRIGYRIRELRLPTVGDLTELNVAMVTIPALLEPMRVSAAASCPRRSDVAEAYSLLEQARAGLLATIVAREAMPATLKMLLYERTMEGNSDRIAQQSVQIDSSAARTVSFSAAGTASDFVNLGFSRDSANTRIFLGPDAEVLLDDGFLTGYCIRIHEPERDRPNQVGLGFSAADHKRGRIDIEGALWIDTVAKTLRDFDFRFVGVERTVGAPTPSGRIWFREMPNGVVLIDRWFFRLIGASADSSYGRNGTLIVREWYFARQTGGEVARAFWPDGTTWNGSLGTVRIHVVDRKGRPATGLIVRLANSDYLASPDERGDVELPDVLPGPYSVTVTDSALASSGISVGTSLNIFAVRDSIVQATLVAPPAGEFQKRACTMSNARRWVPVSVVRGRTPVDDARWEIGEHLGSPDEVILASGITGVDGTFGFCNTSERTLDVRARDNVQSQSVTVTVRGTVKEVKIELPPKAVP